MSSAITAASTRPSARPRRRTEAASARFEPSPTATTAHSRYSGRSTPSSTSAPSTVAAWPTICAQRNWMSHCALTALASGMLALRLATGRT
jgi:hypothetical protein